MIVQAIRSLIFYVLFIGLTLILAIAVTVFVIPRTRNGKAPPLGWGIGRLWGRSTLALLRFTVGIKSEVTGGENIPPGGCIFAAKHQSDWDIFAVLPYTTLPAFIAKKELLDIPFFGWAAKALNSISIDRSRGSEAIPAMVAQAKVKVEAGSQLIIYPEGTRRAPLAAPDYRQGTSRIYGALNAPVVPVAVNSGLFWGRNSLILWPGTARAHFLPPILPGLSNAEFHAKLVEVIEAATNDLILEAADKGLSRPIPPDLRAKLDALAATRSTPA